MTVAPGSGARETSLEVVRALVDAGVAPVGFALEQGGLSDAFLAITEPE